MVGEDLAIIGSTDLSGTTVHFTPDPEIFTETVVFDFDKLAKRIQELAFLNRAISKFQLQINVKTLNKKRIFIMKVVLLVMLNTSMKKRCYY